MRGNPGTGNLVLRLPQDSGQKGGPPRKCWPVLERGRVKPVHYRARTSPFAWGESGTHRRNPRPAKAVPVCRSAALSLAHVERLYCAPSALPDGKPDPAETSPIVSTRLNKKRCYLYNER